MNRFDKEAKEWDKKARRQALAKAVAHHIIDTLPPKLYDILDIGCGTGLVSYNLLSIAGTITGIDTSSQMVEEFNKKSTSRSIYAYHKTLQECSRCFDVALASMTLHHIPNIQEFFQEVAQRLHKGGYLFIADLFKEDGTFHDRGNEGVYHFGFDPKELTILAQPYFKALKTKKIFSIKKHRDFPIFFLALQKL